MQPGFSLRRLPCWSSRGYVSDSNGSEVHASEVVCSLQEINEASHEWATDVPVLRLRVGGVESRQ